MKLAIVGSVLLGDSQEARRIIEHYIDTLKPDTIVSGGAKGIDTLAETIAKERGLKTLIFLPEFHRWANRGYRERNLKIAVMCDQLVRIASQRSTTYGSGWTRDRAMEMGKPTFEVILP